MGRFPCRHNHGHRSSLSFTHTRSQKHTHSSHWMFFLLPASNAPKSIKSPQEENTKQRAGIQNVILGSLCIASWNYFEFRSHMVAHSTNVYVRGGWGRGGLSFAFLPLNGQVSTSGPEGCRWAEPELAQWARCKEGREEKRRGASSWCWLSGFSSGAAASPSPSGPRPAPSWLGTAPLSSIRSPPPAATNDKVEEERPQGGASEFRSAIRWRVKTTNRAEWKTVKAKLAFVHSLEWIKEQAASHL